MKNTLLTIILFSLLAWSYSCTEQGLTKDSNANTDSDLNLALSDSSTPFVKGTGASIDKSVGERWIDNYKKAGNAETHFTVDARVFERMLREENSVGVSLQYAVDTSGVVQLIMMGVAEGGTLLKNTLATTAEAELTWSLASEMMNAHTGSVRAHFFGANSFLRLFNKGCTAVRLSLALNDSGTPQILLSDAGDPSPDGFEDASSLCPPHCGN